MFKHYLNATLSHFLQLGLGFKSQINKTRRKEKSLFLKKKKVHQVTYQREHTVDFSYSVLRIVSTLILENTQA